jgi:hypothetical protein
MELQDLADILNDATREINKVATSYMGKPITKAVLEDLHHECALAIEKHNAKLRSELGVEVYLYFDDPEHSQGLLAGSIKIRKSQI